MVIYTAGYKNWKVLPERAVNTARWAPPWHGMRRHLRAFAPSKAVRDASDWKAAYIAQLCELRDSGKLESLLGQIQEGDVLMCWEKDPAECHRLVLAQWLCENSGGRIVYGGDVLPGAASAPAKPPERSLFDM